MGFIFMVFSNLAEKIKSLVREFDIIPKSILVFSSVTNFPPVGVMTVRI